MGINMAGKTGVRAGIIIILAFYLASLFSGSAQAADEAAFRLDMDSLNLRKGVSCTLVISLVNAPDARIVRVDGMEAFDLLSQSQSTSTTIINNAVTQQVDVYYTLMPGAAGEFSLTGIIEYGGGYRQTNALQVSVTEGPAAEGASVPDIFVKTVLSQEEAWLGEKIIAVVELYSRYSIDSFGFKDYVAVDGAVAKEAQNDPNHPEFVYLDGNRYARYQALVLILDPIRPGHCTIPALDLQVNVITNGGGGGGLGGFFRSTTAVYLQTEETGLTVKPLPLAGRPDGFSGVVGELKLEGRYSREELNYGDSLILYATVSGNCNLDGMKSLIGGGLPGFTVYETQKTAQDEVVDSRYFTRKEYELILVPERTGSLEIEPVSISFFNPASGKYETAELPGAAIEVLGDMPQAGGGAAYPSGQIETVTISQASYTDDDGAFVTLRLPKNSFYALLAGIVLILAGALCLPRLAARRKKRDRTMISLYRRLRGAKDADEMYSAFNEMIKHRYRVNIKASPREAIRRGFSDAAFAAQVLDVMDFAESAEARGDGGLVLLKGKIKAAYSAMRRPSEA